MMKSYFFNAACILSILAREGGDLGEYSNRVDRNLFGSFLSSAEDDISLKELPWVICEMMRNVQNKIVTFISNRFFINAVSDLNLKRKCLSISILVLQNISYIPPFAHIIAQLGIHSKGHPKENTGIKTKWRYKWRMRTKKWEQIIPKSHKRNLQTNFPNSYKKKK